MRRIIIFPLLASAMPVAAQDSVPEPGEPVALPASDVPVDNEIVVTATRIAGQVETDIPPVMVLEPEDIASYGAGTLGELLEAVSPQTSSGRGRGGGRPVILLNGQRISSWRQLRNLPPEAIRRMEVLPEEVALRFGYAPDQRVVNFIIRKNFATVMLAGEYNLPTSGGFAESELEAALVRFDGPRRFNATVKVEDTSLLTEAERGLLLPEAAIPDVTGDPDPARFRSLVGEAREYFANASWTTGLGEGGMDGSFTVDGEVRRNDARSLQGLDTVLLTAPDGASARRTLPGALERDIRTDTLEGGLTLNKSLGAWQLTATADAAYADTRTLTDRQADLAPLRDAALAGALALDADLPAPADPGRDRARVELFTLSAYAGVSGTPFALPAGEAALSVDVGYDRLDNRNSDTRGSGEATRLTRDIFSAGANLALPLTSRRTGFGDSIGDISLNFSGDLHHFSDFGTLFDWSAGVVWSPFEDLTLNASYIVSEVAPSVGQLGRAEIASFNVPVYDFTLGEPALVTVITGGNPNLVAEQQRDIKLAANYKLDWFRRSSLMVEYFRNRSDDVTRSFPLLTTAVESAFPGRVTRDEATGRLVAIDRRPVTFSKVESEHIRWGLNLSGRVAKEAERGEGRRGGGRGMGMPGRGPSGGRWNVSLYHTFRLSDRVTIAPGLAPLDQLDGDALTEGGVPRHAIELEGGVFHKGLGVRFGLDWFAPATVNGSGLPGSSDLRFGSVTTLDARFFVNLGSMERVVAKHPWLKGVRIAFDFDNLLNSRQLVTDEAGLVPLAYQRAYRDPRGRFAGIDIKKSF